MKDREILEEFIKDIKFVEERTLYEIEAKERCKKRYKAIENILKENENLKQAIKINHDLYETKCNENKELKEKMEIREHNYQVAIAETINKYEVKEKIEEIDKEIEELQERFNKTKGQEFCNAILVQIKSKRNIIKVLQDLLGKEK